MGRELTPELEIRPEMRRSKSVGAGRKAWFQRKKEKEEGVVGRELPRVGAGVREEFDGFEGQGKRCVVM